MNPAQQTVNRLRGCAVGALSASTGIAAHGMAGGAVPGTSSLLVMVAACVVLGETVGTTLRRPAGWFTTSACLAFGQVVAHLSLTTLDDATAHGHHGVAAVTPTMAAVHLGVTVVGAVAIRVGETAIPAVLTTIVAALRQVLDPPTVEAPRLDRLFAVSDARRSLRAVAALDTRGPPLMAG
ncbi:hypothetical protein [Gordonia amicalis]|uniref:hypothetical protein n=1 Tax=Gordonia amicalis TaxID=89053 RepID=UPI0002A64272|nr:hypothetical protein [Gordonia amicalis]MCZ4652750.1 hypothetical protein [Gordonia amicalis]NKX76390.1 hypothetical protein [Gordonia amicalis]GAC51381.1 hypothetical protein GOAMI_01_00870 [Gordonia amicalis NBRC 100051 = JCM 11271]